MIYRAARKRASCVEDMRLLARRRLPRAVFDFIDGAAEDETTQRANRDDLSAVRLVPRYLRDVSQRDSGVTVLNRRILDATDRCAYRPCVACMAAR